jgi:DNA (cytosine-5)-methyltransferase 1
MRIVDALAPRWVLIENVFGLLSSHGGRDMGTVLGAMAKLGYGTAYRVLDAQWFGVPQRRRRVFIVGCAGNDWRRAAEVLFEPESLPWNPPPSREAGAKVAHCLARGSCGSHGRYDPNGETYVTAFDCKQSGEGGEVSPPLRALEHDKSHANAGGQVAVAYQCHGSNVGEMGHLRSGNGATTGGVPFVFQPRIGRNERGQPEEICPTLQGADAGATSDMRPCVANGMAVRRITPRECERLQGFPDHWTRYAADGTEIKDGPRYRMIGNAVAVPVAKWIGERIVQIHRAG